MRKGYYYFSLFYLIRIFICHTAEVRIYDTANVWGAVLHNIWYLLCVSFLKFKNSEHICHQDFQIKGCEPVPMSTHQAI